MRRRQGTTLHAPSAQQPGALGVATRATASRRRGLRAGRRGRYALAFATATFVSLVVALIAANARSVRINWLFGSSSVSLVWLILVAAVLGWLAGIATGALVRHRSRSQL